MDDYEFKDLFDSLVNGILIYLSKQDPDKPLPSRESVCEWVNQFFSMRSFRRLEKNVVESQLDSYIVTHGLNKPTEVLPSRNEQREIFMKITNRHLTINWEF